MKFTMQWLQRAKDLWRPRQRPRHALALAGGGVIGGMFEVGAITALEERLNGHGRFDIYVGCSAGAVVASFLANGLPASEIFRVIDNDLDDPLNFRRNAVYASDSFRHAAGRFGRLVWAIGKSAVKGLRGSVPDMLAHVERDLPAGFFSLQALERFMSEAFVKRGLRNSFADLAAEAGAQLVVVVNPLVPNSEKTLVQLRNRGLYSIMEQAGRIYSQNLLQLGLTTLRMKYPRTEFFLIQPTQSKSPLFGPSMGFDASRASLRFGYESTREWLDAHGASLVRRLQLQPLPA